MTNLNAAEKLAKLREGLKTQDEKKTRSPVFTGDNASYPFWNIAEGSSTTVRFLPDKDPENAFFWVERQAIRLPFAGQVGGDYPTDKEVTVTVPCNDMFEAGTCPIIAETKPWWKQGPDKEALARLYYKKRSFIFQGFVVNTSFDEGSVPENPIRRLMINPSIYEIIKQSLMNPEMEDVPTDYFGGRDFKIAKTKKGEFANYSTSSWSFRVRPLNEIENVALTQYGLFNLADYRGARPDADGLLMIKAMFHDSLAGKPFDFEAYGKTYRAYGDRNEDSETPVSHARSAPVEDNDGVVEESTHTSTHTSNKATPKAADLLKRIRERTSA